MTIKNVILDPGHGGLDGSGHYTTAPNKMHKFPDGKIAYEGVINRQIAAQVEKCLEGHGLKVSYTVAPDDPTDVSLGTRVKIANRENPNETLFISIHNNASESHKASGFEIFTSVGLTKSDALAEHIATAVEPLYKKVGISLRYDLSDGDKDKEVDFYVLRKTKCPAVLLECGFFDNKKDFAKLSDPEFQGELASWIATGILNFISDEA